MDTKNLWKKRRIKMNEEGRMMNPLLSHHADGAMSWIDERTSVYHGYVRVCAVVTNRGVALGKCT